MATSEGYWGQPAALFNTVAGTLYRFHLHVGDVGHAALFGQTGTGKTLLAMTIITLLEAAGATRIVLDKDQGCRIAITMAGGRYLTLRRDIASGMAPLKACQNTAADQAFLELLITGLIEQDGHGKLTPDEDARLAKAITRQLSMPPGLRSFDGIRERLGYENPAGAGARLERWCRAGAMGWLFDGEADLIRHDATLLGYDLTELLPTGEALSDDGAAAAAAAYLLFRARRIMDGRRVFVFADEARAYLPVLGRVLEDFALTGRKKDLALWIAAQEPAHIAGSEIGRSLLAQCRTVIAFPNAAARPEAYRGALGFTEAEFAQLTGGMLAVGRCFLLKRSTGSVICRFDLSDLPAHVAALSARASTVALLDRLIAEHGDDPAALWAAFRAAIEPSHLKVAAE